MEKGAGADHESQRGAGKPLRAGELKAIWILEETKSRGHHLSDLPRVTELVSDRDKLR